MLGLLIKKQFTELFRGFFFDQKKGKLRSGAASIVFFVLYAVLIFGILGGMFVLAARTLCRPLVPLGLGWLYFTLMALLALVLGVFGSVFSTYSSLYLAKDNDLLLSMPVPVRTILASRLLSVYLMGLLFSAAATVPAVLVYASACGVTAASVLGGLLYVLVLSLAVLLLSCVLGWVVARLSLRFRNKSWLTVALSLAVVAVYYYFYFRAQEMLQRLLANAETIGEKLGGGFNPLYLLGRGAQGDLLRMLPVLLLLLALLALVWYVLEKSFLGIATGSGAAAKTRVRRGEIRARSVSRALLGRELKHFVSNPNYMLNCGLGVVGCVACAAALLWKGAALAETLGQVFGEAPGAVAVLAAAAVCLLNCMNNITAPSVSLEGKTIWIVQSLPVTGRQAVFAKLRAHLTVALPPMLLLGVCAGAALRLTLPETAALLLLGVLDCVFIAAAGLWLNLLQPNLNWTNEIVPIKQSMTVLLVSLLGFVAALAIAGLYMLVLAEKLSAALYMMLAAVCLAAFDALLLLWLRGRGAAIFEEL